ncbi:glycosyltransferase family 87 protein [Pedobacter antarcticus]|uniref:glycosyltransferase family 87 protein n=1 Tax=Pedobacter antarcticus TaxID=34086 RepID=UPI001C5870C2|nr:glycosyltransferase 87 family protein [Pedobacter antarcticus]
MLSLASNKRSLTNILGKLFNNRLFILSIFIILPAITTYRQYHTGTSHNNYLIFIYTFFHAEEHLNLFSRYPQYGDMNHYGPFFSMLIAPFAMLPEFIGMFFWELVNTLFLYYAIQTLPLKNSKINAVYWIVAHELLTALFACQINPSITAIIILSYTLIDRKQNFWAAFLIMLGTFIKLYGIVGLAFFFFVKEKPKFIAYCIFWSIIFFLTPMIFFGYEYIISQYKEWYISLSAKQIENATLDSWQDISLMGIVRRVTTNPNLSNLPFIIPGIIVFCLPYLRIKQYQSQSFRLMYLASTLIFTVIFSNSSESPTYIIAFAGVAIWFVLQEKPISQTAIALFIFAILLTTLAPSDLYPKYIRVNYIMHYSLKALPCVLIWIYISYQLLFKDFSLKTSPSQA